MAAVYWTGRGVSVSFSVRYSESPSFDKDESEKTMAEPQISYTDGAVYERTIGKWSWLAGERFLEWLAPTSSLSWIDVGCGNGAFTEFPVERCAPREVAGLDLADAQLARVTAVRGRVPK